MKLALLFLFVSLCAAAQWTGIVHSDRAHDWSSAGAGTLPTRTVVCSSLTTSNTLTQINNAIAACPENQVVEFAAGTYTLSGGVVIQGRNNITLRGAGPLSTTLNFTGSNSCGGLGGAMCLRATTLNDVDSPGNTANWTAGYSKGTSTITLSNVTNLQVGSIIMLDQVNDSTTDDNEVWMSMVAGTSCYDCASPGRSSGGTRTQVQASIVTNINGTQVTISPPVIWPNFASGKSPQAWWSSGLPVSGVVIENMTLNTESATGADSSIFLFNAVNSWIRNVRVIHGRYKHVRLYQSVGITVRDSYFYDKYGSDASQEGSESYGVDAYLASNWLVENNIFHHMTSPTMCESGVGGVFAYNYSFDDFYNLSNSDWAQASQYTHGACSYVLHEGNIGFGMIQDIVHAPNYFHTGFRNRWFGWETGKSLQTVAVHIYAPNRFSNIIGNILGTSTYHNRYESYPPTATDCDTSIFALGWGGNCGNDTVDNKPDVRTNLMRWGNWDTVTSTNDNGTNDSTGTKWASGEVPSGATYYPNSVPGSQTLPSSFYLSSRPTTWWRTPWATPAWPPIGPDVSNGTIANSGGHANKTPANLCYDNLSNDGANSYRLFDAATCYLADPTGRTSATGRVTYGGGGSVK